MHMQALECIQKVFIKNKIYSKKNLVMQINITDMSWIKKNTICMASVLQTYMLHLSIRLNLKKSIIILQGIWPVNMKRFSDRNVGIFIIFICVKN